MRYGNLSGRLVLIGDGEVTLDVEKASGGRFGASPQAVYDHWDEFAQWANQVSFDDAEPLEIAKLGAPVPMPRQLLAVGLNYDLHTAEAGLPLSDPPVFTKFVSAITGPYADVPHPGGSTDWEVELVVVIAKKGHKIPRERAWEYVAGLTAGQDLSERELQKAGALPQFNLGKSFTGFCPMGPWVVTPDAVPDKDDLEIETRVNGKVVQHARTGEMLMGVSELIEYLSAVVTLLPGDVIYTGTPAGVGEWFDPPQFLQVGDVIDTAIEGIGCLRNVMVAQTR
ncbi:MAG: fumarylacetoacetate hydrolase family protein [Propionibacteriaceae bacterium]|jgi:2-keto-4-pentenoate hydratase/2-oxohepta-3-ene-1,7-dioic acid hydratase in catechol pathway|nr:fumarylacetoacetate hydrolase family protein [Propionibacteriaceae bacterium]